MRLAVHQRRAGNHGKLGFFLGLDDIELKTGLALDPRHKLGPVGRTTASFGCDQTHPADFVAAEFLLTDAQCLNGARHGSARQTPGFFQARPKLDGLRKTVDDIETAAFGLSDQHPTTICAQIQGCIEFCRSGPNWRRAQRRLCIERARTFGTLWRHGLRLSLRVGLSLGV